MNVVQVLQRFVHDNLHRYDAYDDPDAVTNEYPHAPTPDSQHFSQGENEYQRVDDNRQLKVCTYNTWGVPVAPHLEARSETFCEKLCQSDFDVICFQEVTSLWQLRDIQSACKSAGLAFFQSFNHGIGCPGWLGVEGTGIVVASRFPIIDCAFKKFSANGKPHRLLHMDYFGGKGVGYVEIHTPSGKIDFFSTHLHANYVDTVWHKSQNTRDEYKATRVSQAWEMARFINQMSKPGNPTILAGDFNTIPSDDEYQLIQSQTKMTDAYDSLLGHPPIIPGKLETADSTYGSPQNSHSGPDFFPQRLDHILYRNNDSGLTVRSVEHLNWKDDNGMSVSDHLGVYASFSWCDYQVLIDETRSREEMMKSDVARNFWLQKNASINNKLRISQESHSDETKILLRASEILAEGAAVAKRETQEHKWRGIYESVLFVFLAILTNIWYQRCFLDDHCSAHFSVGSIGHAPVLILFTCMLTVLPIIITIELILSHFVIKADMLTFYHLNCEMSYSIARSIANKNE